MRILVLGGAATTEKNKMVGLVDESYSALAKAKGINAPLGSLRRTGDGRVVVFAKAFPGCHASGYALRSRIVWWINTGEVLKGEEVNLHHKNHDRTDDRFANLELIRHGEHSHHHNAPRRRGRECACGACGTSFYVPKWRETGRNVQFCSMSCRRGAGK